MAAPQPYFKKGYGKNWPEPVKYGGGGGGGYTYGNSSTHTFTYEDEYYDDYGYKKQYNRKEPYVVNLTTEGSFVRRQWSNGFVDVVPDPNALRAEYKHEPAAPRKKTAVEWLRDQNEAVCRLSRTA